MVAPTRRPRLRSLAVAGAVALLGTVAPAAPADAATTELTEVDRFTIPQQAFHSSYNDESMSSVAYGDVTGDGEPDLVVGGMDGYVTISTMSGIVLRRGFTSAKPICTDAAPSRSVVLTCVTTHGPASITVTGMF